MSNPYDGISKVSNSTTWYGTAKTEPLTIASIERGFEAMRQRDEEERQRKAAIGAEYREAMKDKKFAARQNAMYQAAMDVGCPMPDPFNPPLIHPKLYKRLMARTEEILQEGRHR